MDTRNSRAVNSVLITLILILLCFISSRPYLVNRGLPEGNDAELHVFRTAELGYSKLAGQVYPRWAPNFFHGYGYPIFNYYAPLSYHLGYWLTFGQPQNAVAGTLIAVVMAQCWGILGAYLLGKSFGHEGGGLVASATYAFSPYIQFINPHIRGDIAEVVALAFVPWALWAWHKLWTSHQYRYFITAVAFPALALLSHNLTGLITMVMLMVFSAWQWFTRKVHWKIVLRALITGMMILLVTAFFWLPFIVERDAIQLDVAGDGHYDYRNHFVPWVSLIAPLTKLDWSAATPHFPMSAGPLNVLYLIVGIALLIRETQVTKRLNIGISFFVLCAGIMLFMVTQDSAIIWRTLPGIEFFQFPWRFLGPFCIVMIPVVAYATKQLLGLLPQRSHRMTLTIMLVLPVIVGLPGLFVRPWTSLPEVVPAYLVTDYELKGLWRGTTSTNDFVPSSVVMIPGPQESLIESIRKGLPDRVNRYTLPDGTTVNTIPDKPWINHYEVDTGEGILLRLYLFAFPGWQATIDSMPVDIQIAHPEGFITVEVPEGQHDVVIAFTDTPIHKFAWTISLIAVLAIIICGISVYQKRHCENHTRSTKQRLELENNQLIFATCLLIVISFVVYSSQQPGVFYESSPVGEARALPYQQNVKLEDQIELLGYDISHESIQNGRILEVHLAWQAQQPLDTAYQSFVHVLDTNGQIIGQSDHLNPGGFPTYLWPTDRYVVDSHRIDIPTKTTASTVSIRVGIFNITTGERLFIAHESSDFVILDHTVAVK